MNINTFLSHHGLTDNPFDAEEARHDPVFGRLIETPTSHPDFDKILGQIHPASTSVVFGEKGSGKTAIRLMIARRVTDHNDKIDNGGRTLLVAYDELNPVIDRVLDHRRKEAKSRREAEPDVERMLREFKLEDHQDAILSLAVTQLVDQVLEKKSKLRSKVRKLPRQNRVELAVLAALYDQPPAGRVETRLKKLKRAMRLGGSSPNDTARILAVGLGILGVGLLGIHFAEKLFSQSPNPGAGLLLIGSLALAGAVLCLACWGWRSLKRGRLAGRVSRQLRAVRRSGTEMKHLLGMIADADLARQPWPTGDSESRNRRYQLTSRLIDVLKGVGYGSMMVLVDRVDEPTVISGKADRMRDLIWPMFDNKFLQQEHVGLKLLLPLELRHMLYRESPQFFQEARLDKQNMIDRLSWSGTTLYDLCMQRLRTCHKDENSKMSLRDLFAEDVTTDMIVDALDQMHQPRDAFKFLYQLLQEHCQMVAEDQGNFHIARLTLDTVRRMQAQRVQEFYRGQTPS